MQLVAGVPGTHAVRVVAAACKCARALPRAKGALHVRMNALAILSAARKTALLGRGEPGAHAQDSDSLQEEGSPKPGRRPRHPPGGNAEEACETEHPTPLGP